MPIIEAFAGRDTTRYLFWSLIGLRGRQKLV
jgi:hypothetical protein